METGAPDGYISADGGGGSRGPYPAPARGWREAGAATELLREYGAQLNRYLSSLLRDELDAAEAFSAFAETMWRTLPSFRGEASLRTWAFRLAWTSARGLRRSAWRRRRERLRTRDESLLGTEIRTGSAVRRERQRSHLEKLRDSLSLQDRSLLGLRIDQELSWGEIAAILATPQHPVDAAAVTKRFERLKQRLARMAREEGFLE
jgi:RNA polymerase sigma-70 factor (ECF subfamily)